jgi:transposase-like protein
MRCLNASCPSHSAGAPVFRKYGVTRSGSPRFQCLACKKTLSVGKSTLRQKQPHKNALVFELLINKVPLRRIREVTDLSAAGLYGKINFIYEQCRAFVADRERDLAAMTFDRLYLSTDRQDYLVNWPDKAVRKTIQLTAIATADLNSGYVFGLTPNYDPLITQSELEALWAASNDQAKPLAMRDTARLWTLADYAASTAKSGKPPPEPSEPPEDLSDGQQLPKSGCQVHADYLMYGHYWLLRHHLQGAGKIRFFLDGDAGLLAACIGAFADRVKARTVDIAVLQIDKQLTVDARNAALAKAAKWLKAEQARFPGLSERQARSEIMTEIVAAARSNAPDHRLQNVWIGSPFPDLAEPNKRIRFITDFGDYDDAHIANLLLKATLWPIDSVFNRVRRRLTFCERPVNSSRRANRRWHIYAPYDPQMIEKVLTIFRVWHNYVWIGEKSNATAAERIGLAQGKIRIQDILNFKQP